MSEQAEIRNELSKSHSEPLLPVEKKLIGWSLATGIVLLIVLVLASKLFPA